MLFESTYFDLEQVAEGVYAAIVRLEGGGASNAGFVDLGDRVLVVDTFRHPQAAHDLRRAAEQLTGHPVAYVVNTHYHGERVLGNQVFADATIIATERTREGIEAENGEFVTWARVPGNVDEFLAGRAQEAEAATDPRERERLFTRLAGDRELGATTPTLELTLPNLLFERRLVLHGSARTAEVIHLGSGHSASDTMIYLPAERVAFTSDVLVVQRLPAFTEGEPDEWLQMLDRVERFDIATVVPGHGPFGSLADLPTQRNHIHEMIRTVGDLIEQGRSVDDLSQIGPSSPYDEWQWHTSSGLFEHNLRFLYDWLSRRPAVAAPGAL